VKEERNIPHTINKTGHILRSNCLLKHVIEGNIEGRGEVTRRREEDVSSFWMTFK
jgi:hypothetical protein